MKKSIYLTFVILITIVGCSEKEEIKKAPEPVNFFSMEIDGQPWEPSIIDDDACYATYRCEYSILNDKPYYTINAYKDSKSIASYESENIFRFQVMNVLDVGTYGLSEPFGGFNSYARFAINKDGTQKVYGNSIGESSLIIKIEEILPVKGSSLLGVKGTFSGVLFNIDDQDDFIIIGNGKFTFNRIKWNDFCQCAE